MIIGNVTLKRRPCGSLSCEHRGRMVAELSRIIQTSSGVLLVPIVAVESITLDTNVPNP